MYRRRVDQIFFFIVVALVGVGISIFFSAALSVLPKSQSQFYGMILSQLGLGLSGGILVGYIASRIRASFWRQYSFWLFLGAIILTAIVLIPEIGFKHGGARRWILLGPVSFQPSEFLKVGFVIYCAAWFSWVKSRVAQFKSGLLPLIIMIGICGLILLPEPDTDTFLILAITGVAMFFIAGGKLKHLLVLALVGLVGFGALIASRPYIVDRLKTFRDPTHDPLGTSYQIQQSLIAVGSGGVFGRGFGQSVQKFNYLPEPVGDTIFAVAAEEFGFAGSIILIILFTLFCLRGLRIAHRTPDQFSRLLVSGLVILIGVQSFLNIASILGIFPLAGMPLVFVSHGGTALLMALFSVGIILGVSRYSRT